MTIVADENVDREIVDRLRADGHDVLFIAEDAPGIDDQAVLDRSRLTWGWRVFLRKPEEPGHSLAIMHYECTIAGKALRRPCHQRLPCRVNIASKGGKIEPVRIEPVRRL